MGFPKEGDAGPEVTRLQAALQRRGFSPGAIDGVFGPGTEAALIGFQKSEGLADDGEVDAETVGALGLASAAAPTPTAMPDVPVAVVSKMFPMTPLGNIKTNLSIVLNTLKVAGLTSLPIVLCALATIRAETESFEPVSEGRSRFNTSPGGHPFDLYDFRKDLGNQGPPDGADFKGRGFIQLTGRANYEKFGPIIGVPDLAVDSEKANDPGIAAQLLAAFIKDKAGAISQALRASDLRTARRLVNGGSNGLDRFQDAYTIGQKLLAAS